MAFSDRPGKCLAMAAHLFPKSCCKAIINLSSLSVHLPFFKAGSRWLHQRSLHCFAMRPGNWSAMDPHFWGPCLMTSAVIIASSSSVQPPLTIEGRELDGGIHLPVITVECNAWECFYPPQRYKICNHMGTYELCCYSLIWVEATRGVFASKCCAEEPAIRINVNNRSDAIK